jgi:hypothetical protein
MRLTNFFLTFVVSFGLTAAAGCEAMGVRKAAYDPHVTAADFPTTPRVDHPYFPLVPGTTFRYVEKGGGETSDNEVVVTHETKTVMGIPCVVVHDTVKVKGQLKEDTYDWYAQDSKGTVWYMGESTREYKPGGQVSTEGSWEAGVKGGKPGVIMPANPAPSKPYRQEYMFGTAEDMGQVVATNESVTVPAGTFNDCVKTKDWSLLEAGHEYKWYARGVGVVKAQAVPAGDLETLVSVTKE